MSVPRVVGPPETKPRHFHGIYTVAPEMAALFDGLRRVARAECTVLLVGETGTGKELFARALHAESPRAKASFHAINCATLSPTLLESELFGHVRGAFTGAIRDHPGLFVLANRGTVFLDEVAEIPLGIQGKLLRVLQERTFVPVGGTRATRVDVRVISASNKAIRHEVAVGRFREDLAYRLRVVPIYLPALRQRTGDVEALLWHFIRQMNGRNGRRIESVTRRALDAITAYPWPGNVRELQNVVEYASVMGEGSTLDLGDLTPEVRGDPIPLLGRQRHADRPAEHRPAGGPESEERARILAALAKHGGRKAAAAAELGISRQTLWRKLYVHGLW